GLLEGAGKQVRSIRLTCGMDIDLPEVKALVTRARLPFETSLLAAPPLTTVIKLVAAKQRPRRPSS
ncbi:MAG: hypothetical protein ABI870_16140, partial [Rhodanobacter sp.]